jgi:DNA repair protein RadC
MIDLFIRTGGRYRVARRSEVAEVATQYAVQRMTVEQPRLSSPKDARDYIGVMRDLDHECFGVVYLNVRHVVLAAEVLFRGTIDASACYPRDIAKRVLDRNAVGVILFHNHPSGNPDASAADTTVTLQIRKALALFGARVIDHLIVAGDTVTSLAERGLI